MLSALWFIGRACLSGLIGWAFPRLLIAAGMPLDRWLIQVAKLLPQEFRITDPQSAAWLITAVVGLAVWASELRWKWFERLISKTPPERVNEPLSEAVGGRELAPVVFANSFDELRENNEVEMMDELVSGRNLSQMPNGTYGFIYAYKLPQPGGWDIIGIGEHEISPPSRPVYKTRTSQDQCEIHKSRNSALYITGFVSRETLSALRRTESASDRDFILFFDERAEFNCCVAVPYSNLKSLNSRMLDGATSVLDIRFHGDTGN